MEIRKGLGLQALPSMTLLRELTDQIVLDTVFEQAPITRAEIAQQTGISKTTVSEAVRRLEGAGLLLPAGEQRGRQGRVGTYYKVASTAGFVVAVDLNPTQIRLCAADLFGQPFLESAHPPVQPREPARVAEQLRELVSKAIAEGNPGRGRPLAVAVSVANPVDPATSRVIPLADTPYPEGLIQPQEALDGLIDAPILVENDVNLAAIAERWHGAARTADSFAYVYIGAGMGMGLLIGDQLIRGARGVAGEIGYLSVSSQPPGPLHGRHGFARAIAAAGFHPSREPGSDQVAVDVARQVFDRAAKGNAEAKAVVEEEGRTIGEAIAAVCAVVDPELVLLGGPIGLHPALLEPVRATVQDLAPLPPAIEVGTLGDAAVLHGALALALRRARADLWAGVSRQPS
ncbi:ROK family transcriptional regulator [Streptomyces sp. RB6PN25]|uniref:ROK family transcriptional regulator n=1 Tax=Streptomyces humicola TaxID=2953240 RepID=A0ABT1PT44_9ACTN|nr:ROK family transcriptional regulator [Streptomyces humicola]MCQ4080851.1 ROK family transcriptional regulator [Streptomyces humicola]